LDDNMLEIGNKLYNVFIVTGFVWRALNLCRFQWYNTFY